MRLADVAELADALASGASGSNTVGVQVPSSAPRRNGLCSVPIFVCTKISHTLCRSSSFVKSHARFDCSFVNALTAAHCHYQLFTILCASRTWKLLILLCFCENPVRTLEPTRSKLCLFRVFLQKISQSLHLPLFSLKGSLVYSLTAVHRHCRPLDSWFPINTKSYKKELNDWLRSAL